MYYRIKFILHEMFVSPILLFWKQILISSVLASPVLLVKSNIYLYLTTLGFWFLISMMVTMANDSYNRKKQRMLEDLSIKK
jgi:hypothetical protein